MESYHAPNSAISSYCVTGITEELVPTIESPCEELIFNMGIHLGLRLPVGQLALKMVRPLLCQNILLCFNLIGEEGEKEGGKGGRKERLETVGVRGGVYSP